VDAKGIQLRILAHLINSKEFTDVLLNGDPHQVNADALGITRPNAKTFIYAYLLGAGDAKIGSIVGKDANEGKRIKEAFLAKWPGLKRVREWLKECARVGYMCMPDGRRIAVENAHYGMGVALQGIESIIMRQAMVLWYSRVKELKLDAKIVAWIHDEVQLDCSLTNAEEAGIVMVESIQKAGQLLKLNCPMDGEFKIGMNWCETH
jgi:DNA polymerase-1